MQPSRGMRRLVIFLALPLLLSQCAQNQTVLSDNGLGPLEAATLAGAYDSYERHPVSRSNRKIKNADSDQDPGHLKELGDLFLQNRDYESSLLSYLQILQTNPGRHDLRYRVGVIFLLTGQLEAARKELARVLLAAPDMLAAHEALGLVHLQEKQYALAISEFKQVLAREPNRAKTRHLLGIAYLGAGKFRDAVAALEAAAALDSRHPGTYTALGRAYLKLKDYQKAVTWLKKGQGLDPKDTKINYFLGMALAGLQRYPEALQAFRLAGDEAQAYNNIGVHYFLEGRYEEAARCFQRAIELRPTFYQEAKTNLHRALEKLQQLANNNS
ncbi:MAG: tetratricopeptide repeat protein [Thermodesulfobacteriota bacterium]